MRPSAEEVFNLISADPGSAPAPESHPSGPRTPHVPLSTALLRGASSGSASGVSEEVKESLGRGVSSFQIPAEGGVSAAKQANAQDVAGATDSRPLQVVVQRPLAASSPDAVDAIRGQEPSEEQPACLAPRPSPPPNPFAQ